MPNIRDIKYGTITVNEFDYGTLPINKIGYSSKTVFLNDNGPQPGFGNIIVSSPNNDHLECHIDAGTYPNSYNPGTWITLQSMDCTFDDFREFEYFDYLTEEGSRDPNYEITRADVHLIQYYSAYNYVYALVYTSPTVALAEAVEHIYALEGLVVNWGIKLGEVPATYRIKDGAVTQDEMQEYAFNYRKDFLVSVEDYVTNETTDIPKASVWSAINLYTPTSDSAYADASFGCPVVYRDSSTPVPVTGAPAVKQNFAFNAGMTPVEYVPEVTNVQASSLHFDYYLLDGVTPNSSTLAEAIRVLPSSGKEALYLGSQLIARQYGSYSDFQETMSISATLTIKKHTSVIPEGLKNSIDIGRWQNYSDVVETKAYNGLPELDIESLYTSAIEGDVLLVIEKSRTQPTGYAPSSAPAYDDSGVRIGYYVEAPSIISPIGNKTTTSDPVYAIHTISMGLVFHLSKDNVCTKMYMVPYEYIEDKEDVTEYNEAGEVLCSIIHSPKMVTYYRGAYEKEYT